MGRIARGAVGAIFGYAAGAAIGGGLVSLASGNAHDKSLEAVMTAFFAAGPVGAVAGLIIGLALGRRGSGPRAEGP